MHVTTQDELEDKVLMLLASAHGSLLEDASLIDTLDASKASWESTHNSLQVLYRCVFQKVTA